MTSLKFTIIIEKADELFQASVAELPGAISIGVTPEEARENLDEAIELVLEGNRILAQEREGTQEISCEVIEYRAA
ncbi:MAG TPA: type II toxin-antitoxin system HicB family antitoxin [Pyrinomonadaceae bacterium]|jgi:predicted RNase H-like HicB family nuclease